VNAALGKGRAGYTSPAAVMRRRNVVLCSVAAALGANRSCFDLWAVCGASCHPGLTQRRGSVPLYVGKAWR